MSQGGRARNRGGEDDTVECRDFILVTDRKGRETRDPISRNITREEESRRGTGKRMLQEPGPQTSDHEERAASCNKAMYEEPPVNCQ